MKMQWFRFYGEFLNDPIIRMLSFEDQRHFVAALCLKSNGTLDKEYPSPAIRRKAISSSIGLSDVGVGAGVSAFDEANRRLAELGLIDADWQPINWDKRQFRSDRDDPTAADRMRRYRNKRNATVTPPYTAVTVTALDTDTDTDTDTEQKQSKKVAKAPRPKGSKKAPDDFTPDRQFAITELPDLDVDREIAKFRDWEFKTPRSDWNAVWRTWIRNARDRKSYSKQPGADLSWR